MAKKYKIKEGVLFRPYGSNSLITNDNLTDTMAEMFISKRPELLGAVIVKVVTKTAKKPAKKTVKKVAEKKPVKKTPSKSKTKTKTKSKTKK